MSAFSFKNPFMPFLEVFIEITGTANTGKLYCENIGFFGICKSQLVQEFA